jgi:lipid-A-disaccharide synthase
MFVAGDPSGDKHASFIVKRLKNDLPQSDIWGIGGPDMQAAGFRPLMPFEPFNKMGFLEVALHLAFFLNVKKYLLSLMKKQAPDCLVCVDYPGFNMPLMKAASNMGIPVVWYIAPMVWAWKTKRAQVLGEHAAHIACIFPFEVCYFKPFTQNVSFIGNPVVEAMNGEEKKPKRYNNTSRKIAIVPGSRKQEVRHLIGPMVGAFSMLKKSYPDLTAEISHCPFLPQELYEEYTHRSDITISSDPLRELYSRCDCAMVTSGTATLEAALMGTPHVIAYKTSLLTYSIAKHFLKIPYIGLPNIISQEQIVPECIQHDATPEVIAKAMDPFLSDRLFYQTTVTRLIGIRNHLGSHIPSEELTRIIKNVVVKKQQV